VSVAGNLALFHGVWLDHVVAHRPDGTPITDDFGGPFPFRHLVYLDFDGVRLTQTNVVLDGRPPRERTFRAEIVDGVLVFDGRTLTEPNTIGVSGGPGVLVFLPRRVDSETVLTFADPDYVRHLGGHQRTRTTTLYRDGELHRILTVAGTRIHPDPSRRVPQDPRGPEGPVHAPFQEE
jgi:hypothetical protein